MKSSLLTAGRERSTITMRIEIHVDKLYRYERKAEPCYIGIPMKKGTLYDLDKVAEIGRASCRERV